MAAQPAKPLEGYTGYAHFNITSPAAFVAHVEINRPRKLNSFIREMWLELRSIFAQLSSDPDVRAVVLTGAGDKAFTTGLDVQAAAESDAAVQGASSDVDGARTATKMRRHVYEFQECITAVEKCEKREWLPSPLGLQTHPRETCLSRPRGVVTQEQTRLSRSTQP